MKLLSTHTVERIRDAGFCIGCGTCKQICPVNAIDIIYSKSRGQYIPKVNIVKCTRCGLCLNICPGDDLNHKELSQFVHKKQPSNPYIGAYEKIYIASSQDEEIRSDGASGGFVTQLLTNLLNTRAVDAVLVAGMETGNLNQAHMYLVKKVEDLPKYQRSVYTNVHWANHLSEIQKLKLRTAVVALPCHLHAMNKFMQIKPELREYIRYTIGLFCGGTYKGNTVLAKLSEMKIRPEEVSKIDYRWGEWPGKMRITLKNGESILTSRDEVFKTGYLKRCYFCFDFLADLADVSVGDNWSRDTEGSENVVIVRQTKILPYLDYLNLKEIDENKVVKSHNLMSYRQRFIKANTRVSSFFRQPTPKIVPYNGIKTRFKHYINALLEYCTFNMNDVSMNTRKRFLKLKGIYFHFIMKPESDRKKK